MLLFQNFHSCQFNFVELICKEISCSIYLLCASTALSKLTPFCTLSYDLSFGATIQLKYHRWLGKKKKKRKCTCFLVYVTGVTWWVETKLGSWARVHKTRGKGAGTFRTRAAQHSLGTSSYGGLRAAKTQLLFRLSGAWVFDSGYVHFQCQL